MFYDFYVGSYAPADHESIYRYQLNGESGALTRKGAVKGVDNPSWLLVHPNRKLMYSVEELNPDGRVAVYCLENGAPEYLFSLETEGADPCHLSLSPGGRFLFAANYSGGSLVIFRLDSSGRPEVMTDHKQHVGKGVNPDRQEGPHMHFSQMIDGLLYVCDLGLDRIVVYSLDEETGRLTESGKDICFPGGYGPRHLAVHAAHKGFMYVIGELTGELCVLQNNGDRYELIQRVSTLPENCTGENAVERNADGKDIAGENTGGKGVTEEKTEIRSASGEDAGGGNVTVGNTAAAIRFSEDGRLLFVSNRGADTITSFRMQADGKVEKADCIFGGGSGPRDFAVFGKYIVVANQYSDNLAVIELLDENGKMKLLSVNEPVTKPSVIA